MFISPNTLTIECIIKASGGTTQYNNPFGTQQQLQNRKVVAIETYSAQDVRFSPISTANPNLPQIIFNNAFLRLYTASLFGPVLDPITGKMVMDPVTKKPQMQLERPEGLYYDLLPLPRIRILNNYDTTIGNVTSSSNTIFRMRPTEVSWTKSSVIIPNPASQAVDYSAIFTIHYLDEGDDGMHYKHF